ncbi:hypothetical protein [Psychroflexus tropicus]|uniref:hypothetical protein n=1 Tax=Psychroflexus tropicus TaxID=197345 RepID=UPI0003811941|nr:hypothetical protein [Psychroflexus tropicus]
MRRVILLMIIAVCLSCDDGDIIVSDFNFDADSSLNLCEFENNRKVLHIVTESNEAISFTFEENILENIENIIDPVQFTVEIDGSNRINYRRLSSSVESNDYFCQEIPPGEPTVVEEFASTNGGSVLFTISRASGEGVDTDGDGIPDLNERATDSEGNFIGDVFGHDTDQDGIPNFLDIDDDNDNVPTVVEIGGTDDSDIDLDTDGDGVRNYLDEDDDGDGVLTRNEDLNAFEEGTPEEPVLNPRDDDSNDDGIPNYLDASISEEVIVDFFRDNVVSRNFNITVVFNNITLQNIENERTIRFNSQGFGTFSFPTSNEVIDFRE